MTSAAIRTVILLLRDPLPGYRYSISWELPETEAQEIALSDAARHFAQEIRERLRRQNCTRAVVGCLDDLRKTLAGTEPADAALFVYDEGARGLVPSAFAGSTGFAEEIEGKVVKVGRTLVGQAHRRRQTVVSVAGASSEFYFDPVTDPAALHTGRTASLAIPLVYPVEADERHRLRVAVLWLGTNSRLSVLIRLLQDPGLRDSLIELATAWFNERLLPALDLTAPPHHTAPVKLDAT